MTTAEQVKKAGYKSLQQLSELSGWPIRSIQRMPKAHPKRFNTVLNGAKANINKDGEE